MCAQTSSVIRTHLLCPEIEKYALITFYKSVQMCTHTSSTIRLISLIYKVKATPLQIHLKFKETKRRINMTPKSHCNIFHKSCIDLLC